MSQFRLFKGSSAASTLACSLFLLLQGCAHSSPATLPADLPPTADAATSPLVAWASVQTPGRYADTVLDDPAFGKQLTVQLESQYFSALGMPCRRARVNVVVNGPPAETVAVCQDDNGRWFLAPRIWKSTVAGNRQ